MIGRIALGLLLLASTATAEALPKKSLDECIELALDQQPRLKAAGSTVEAARERVWQSTAAYLPQVTASYQANRRQATQLRSHVFVGPTACRGDIILETS